MTKSRLFLVLAMCLLAGCASFSGKKRMELFDNATKTFEHALLRSNYLAAERFLDTSDDRTREPYEPDENIKVVNFKPLRVVVSDDRKKVVRDLEVQYFHMDRNILKSMRYRQEWHYKPETKTWLLSSDLPVFK